MNSSECQGGLRTTTMDGMDCGGHHGFGKISIAPKGRQRLQIRSYGGKQYTLRPSWFPQLVKQFVIDERVFIRDMTQNPIVKQTLSHYGGFCARQPEGLDQSVDRFNAYNAAGKVDAAPSAISNESAAASKSQFDIVQVNAIEMARGGETIEEI